LDALAGLQEYAKKRGISESRSFFASLGIASLLFYGGIYAAAYGLGVAADWAHALTLFLVLSLLWGLFAPSILAEMERAAFALEIVAALIAMAAVIVAFVGYSASSLRVRLALGALLIWLVIWSRRWLTAPRLTTAWGTRLRDRIRARCPTWIALEEVIPTVSGLLAIALVTFSIPAFATWLNTPAATAKGKIGVWIARFDGDADNEVQQSLLTGIESVIIGDPELRKLMEIKTLPFVLPVDLEHPTGTATTEDMRAALGISMLLYGRYSATQANVFTQLPNLNGAFSPYFFMPVFNNVPIGGTDQVGAVQAIGSYIAGAMHLSALNACPTAEQQFRTALERAERIALLKDKVFPDGIRLAVAQSITCQAVHGTKNAARLRDGISLLEAVATRSSARLADSAASASSEATTHAVLTELGAQIALGYAHRILSEASGEPSAGHLRRAITHYERGLELLAARSREIEAAAKLSPSLLTGTVRSNLGVSYEKLAQYENDVANLRKAIVQYDGADAALCVRRSWLASVPKACAFPENNRGVSLQRLAEAGEDPAANLRKAVTSYSAAASRVSAKEPADKSGYALYMSNLADAHRLLARHEDRDTHLRRAREAIDKSLDANTIKDDTGVFAEAMFKSGQIDDATGQHRRDPSLVAKAVSQWACSLTLFDRLKSGKAHTVAGHMRRMRESRGETEFARLLASAPPRGCAYRPADVLRLIDAYSG
jgi:tetratricopeptide (TPR) repeat protein